MKDVQQLVSAFTCRHGLNLSPDLRLLDLASEVGELCKELLKGSNYGKESFSSTIAWQQELGDVLFALICVANSTGVDLSEALQGVLRKYEQRYLEKGQLGSDR